MWDNLIRPLSFIADVMLVQPRVEFILSFIDHIAGDEDRSKQGHLMESHGGGQVGRKGPLVGKARGQSGER